MAQELTSAPIVPIESPQAAYFVVLTSGGVNPGRRVAVDTVAEGLAKATTAVQPEAIGSAAYLSEAEIDDKIATATGDIEAVLLAVLGPR